MYSTEFFTFDTGTATDVGLRRQVNEDSLLAAPESGVWVVADGMGGHAAGDFASQTIVAELESLGRPASADDLQARFMERLTHANEIILAHARKLESGSIGATMVALLIHDRDYACIWSGDSRAYLMRRGQMVPQSRDHTEVRALLDAGTITEAEAAVWPRRNVITKAIGVTLKPDCDMISGTLEVGDRLLLCSDGLTEHLSDSDIAMFLGRSRAQKACDAMVAKTLERGARDNVTVVALHCLPPPSPPEEETLDPALDALS